MRRSKKPLTPSPADHLGWQGLRESDSQSDRRVAQLNPHHAAAASRRPAISSKVRPSASSTAVSPAERLPTLRNHVAVLRVELDQSRLGPSRGEHACASASKTKVEFHGELANPTLQLRDLSLSTDAACWLPRSRPPASGVHSKCRSKFPDVTAPALQSDGAAAVSSGLMQRWLHAAAEMLADLARRADGLDGSDRRPCVTSPPSAGLCWTGSRASSACSRAGGASRPLIALFTSDEEPARPRAPRSRPPRAAARAVFNA